MPSGILVRFNFVLAIIVAAASTPATLLAADHVETVLSHLPKGAFAGILMQPASSSDDPKLQLLPIEIVDAAAIQSLGISLRQIDAAVVFVTTPVFPQPRHGGVMFHLNSGNFEDRLDLSLTERFELSNGAPYLKLKNTPNDVCYTRFEDGTELVGTEEAVKQSLLAAGTSPISRLLAADRDRGQVVAAVDIKPILPLLAAVVGGNAEDSDSVNSMQWIPFKVDSARVWVDFSRGIEFSAALDSSSPTAAHEVADALSDLQFLVIESLIQQQESRVVGSESIRQATIGYLRRMGKHCASQLKPQVNGATVTIRAAIDDPGIIPLAAALFIDYLSHGNNGRPQDPSPQPGQFGQLTQQSESPARMNAEFQNELRRLDQQIQATQDSVAEFKGRVALDQAAADADRKFTRHLNHTLAGLGGTPLQFKQEDFTLQRELLIQEQRLRVLLERRAALINEE